MRTLGVEEEYGLVDPATRELVPVGMPVRKRAEHSLAEAVENEFKASQIEIATPICKTLDDVERELRSSRAELVRDARAEGGRLIAAGAHPFSRAGEQPVTAKERYETLSAQYRELAREIVIFGNHVHVGIDDPELTIAVFDRAREQLSPLIALAANSPFWEGRDTGYASYRTEVWARWPLSGAPGAFGSRAAYDRLVHELMESGSIDDETKIYWDLRPSARFPTLEFRATDVCARVEEAVAMAGLIRALVDTCANDVTERRPGGDVRSERIRVAHWLAARNGIAGELADLQTNRSDQAARVIRRFVERLRPALRANGDEARVEATVEAILEHGNGADRRRRAHARGGFEAVVDELIEETAA